MDDQRKDQIGPEGPLHGNRPKQLQTHNRHIDDVKSINSTNKEKDLQLASKPQVVP